MVLLVALATLLSSRSQGGLLEDWNLVPHLAGKDAIVLPSKAPPSTPISRDSARE